MCIVSIITLLMSEDGATKSNGIQTAIFIKRLKKAWPDENQEIYWVSQCQATCPHDTTIISVQKYY